jgi:hypothetical protein
MLRSLVQLELLAEKMDTLPMRELSPSADYEEMCNDRFGVGLGHFGPVFKVHPARDSSRAQSGAETLPVS